MKHKLIVKCVLAFLGVMLSVESQGLSILPRPRSQLAQIQKSIEIYAMKHDNRLPESLDELFQFASNYTSYGKPLLEKEDLIDPWGEPFGYERDGYRYVLWSSGPDKKTGTEDDFVEGSSSLIESWKARHTQAIAEQETNAVQEATAGAVQLPVAIEKTQTNRVPVTATQPQKNEPDETKSIPWKIPLLIGIFIFGCVTVWCCFRKRKRG